MILLYALSYYESPCENREKKRESKNCKNKNLVMF